MKKLILSILSSIIVSNTTIAQENQVNISFKPRLSFNNLDVYHDAFMNDALGSRQVLDGSVDLVYKRITRSGLTYGGGFDLGRRSERISIQYPDLSDFREDGQFNGISYYNNIDSKFGYVSIGAFIGYEYNLNKEATSSIAAEFWVKNMLPFEGETYESVPLLARSVVDNSQLQFGSYDWVYGSGGSFFAGPFLFEGAVTYNFSLGRTKRQFFVGVMGTINAFFFNAPGSDGRVQSGNFMMNDYTTKLNGQIQLGNPQETYYEVLANKYTSIGLKVGMNLYKF